MFQKKRSISASLTVKVFDLVNHTKLENSLRDGNTSLPDLPPEKTLSGQEATFRTGHGITDWFQIGK